MEAGLRTNNNIRYIIGKSFYVLLRREITIRVWKSYGTIKSNHMHKNKKCLKEYALKSEK